MWNGLKKNIIWFKSRVNYSTNYLFNFYTRTISDFFKLKGQEAWSPHKS